MEEQRTRMDRRSFLYILGVGGVGLVACGAPPAAAPTATGATSGSAAPSASAAAARYTGQFSVSNYTALADWAPLIIAQVAGYFAKRNLYLNVLQLSQGADAVRAASAQAGLGAAATFSGVTAIDAGMTNLKIVANMVNAPGMVFLVRPDSGITSPTQLKGKKIGVQGETSSATYVGKMMILQAGLKIADAEWVNVGGVGASQTALANKVVDATFSLPPLSIVEVNAGRAKVLVDTRKVAPNLPQSSLFATDAILAKNPDVVDRWIDATNEGMKMIRDDMNTAAQIWAQFIGVDQAIALATLKDQVELFDTRVTKASIDSAVQAAKDMGLMKSNLTYEQVVPEKYRVK